ncbi:hypothetical protein C6A85_22110, partial [Mycobacterium sp. ITM-2017-0098]
PESTFGAIGAATDEGGFEDFYRHCGSVTARLWPTLSEPLQTRPALRRTVVADGGRDAESAWHTMIERPIGHAITAAVADDLVRGV